MYKIIVILLVTLFLAGCTHYEEGDAVDKYNRDPAGYFTVVKRVDNRHYIVSDPYGNKYYGTASDKFGQIIIGGEFHCD